MVASITSLQNEPNLTVFRKCEIKRRAGSAYETDFQDITNLVTQWPSIAFELDVELPFTYRVGSADMSFRNDEKQFSKETFAGSIFAGFKTRYKTLCRISTGLEDTDGNQLPTSSQVFIGVFSDNVIDGEVETNVTINHVSQALSEFPASTIAGSVTGLTLTSEQILSTIRDTVDSNSITVLGPFLSTTQWLLTNTGRFYTVGTTTELDGISALDLISDLATAENFTFFIDGAGNLNFRERTLATGTAFDFNGPGSRDVNIVSVDDINEGIFRVFTKVSVQLSQSVVSTQEAFAVGDNSSSFKFGEREFFFSNNFIDTTTAGSIASDILTSFVNPKQEVRITTKYITNLNLLDRVAVKYLGQPGGNNALWDIAIWDQDLYSDEKGGISLDDLYSIIGININMEEFTCNFHVREE